MGHLPRTISTMCLIFIRCGGIYYIVSGRWQYSRDLPEGGMEILCILHFAGNERELKNSLENFHDWRLIRENCESFPPRTICIIRYKSIAIVMNTS